MKPLITALASASVLFLATAATAQQFPSKPITLVVPFAAGGPIDVTARLVGDHMARTLGQPVVLENVGGAGGTTGAARVARAAADGHTLLIHQVALAVGGALYPNLSYDGAKDFQAVGMVNQTPMIIVAKKALPANNVSELKAYGAANPVAFAHAGVGSMAHLCGVLFSATLGIKANQVAYRGGGPALNDVAAGHVDLFCSSTQTATPLINGGQMKGIGVTSKEPSKTTPPAESLVTHPAVGAVMDISFWQAIFAPKATPEPVLAKLNEALRKAVSDPDVARKFTETGVATYPAAQMTPDYAQKFFLTEVTRWSDFVKKNNIAVGN